MVTPVKRTDLDERYIVQDELPPEISYLIGGTKPPIPKTAAISSLGLLKQFSREHILGQTDLNITQALIVPEKIVEAWGLKEGDRIRYNPNGGFFEIHDVNGITSPEKLWGRPNILDFDTVFASYPTKRLPIDQFGNPILRAFTILAPIGKGQRLIIASPPDSGKSTILRFLWEALLKLTLEDKRLYVMALLVGERAEDAEKLKRIELETNHDKSRVEFYQSPFGEPAEAHFYMAEAFINRARRLCEGSVDAGFDVVALIDCASRVLLAHSYSSKIEKPKGAGLIASGVSTASIMAVRKLLSAAGDFGNRSLTLAVTMLTDDKKAKKRSSETTLYDDTGPSTATSIWALVRLPNTVPHPWIDVTLTHTRLFEQLCTPGQLDEHKQALIKMWTLTQSNGETKPAKASEALREIMKYSRENPKYQSTIFATKLDTKVG